MKRILMVVTSHGRIDDNHATGLWFEEFALPYRLFREAGLEVAVASIRGGAVPLDPRSLTHSPDAADRAPLEELQRTLPLLEVDPSAHDAVFFAGGHGTMYDFPENLVVTRLVERFALDGKVIGAVCHGAAALIGATGRSGRPLVEGRRIAAFTNEEERGVGLDERLPFLLETRLKDLGAQMQIAPRWEENAVVDGTLVTGQNPRSSSGVAEAIIRLVGS